MNFKQIILVKDLNGFRFIVIDILIEVQNSNRENAIGYLNSLGLIKIIIEINVNLNIHFNFMLWNRDLNYEVSFAV